MTGYCYGEDEPLEPCPYCQTLCHADFVDVGIGYTQCGPFHCQNCGSSEIGSYDKKRELSDIERKTQWYAPHSEPGSSANVIGGKVVSYRQMQKTYENEFYANPQWQDKEYVDEWWENIRKSE